MKTTDTAPTLARRLRIQRFAEQAGEPCAHYRDAIEAADELDRLTALAAQQAAEIADLKVSVIAFGAPAMVEWAKDHGLPDHHLYAHHYDILAKAGARMVAFKRWEEAADA